MYSKLYLGRIPTFSTVFVEIWIFDRFDDYDWYL